MKTPPSRRGFFYCALFITRRNGVLMRDATGLERVPGRLPLANVVADGLEGGFG